MDQFDPAQHTVDEVNGYLADAEPAERERVIQAESDGQARKGVLEGPWAKPEHLDPPEGENAPQEPQDGAQEPPEGEDGHQDTPEPVRDATGAPLTTKAARFADAAAKATPSPVTSLGESPEALRTGRTDKGLSQRNPAILTGGPVPDSRRGVDDSAALAALAGTGNDDTEA